MSQDAKVLEAPTKLTLQNNPHSLLVYLSGETLYFPAQNLLSPLGDTTARNYAESLPHKCLAVAQLPSRTYLVTL